LDPSIGEFILTGEKLRIPDKPKTIYSINEGNYITWDNNMQRAVDGFKFNQPTPYTARYVGSMVADVHRTLLYGGIYMYPADAAKVLHLMNCISMCVYILIMISRAMESYAFCTRDFPWLALSRMLGETPPPAFSAETFVESWIPYLALFMISALCSWDVRGTCNAFWSTINKQPRTIY
jgi:hypothetical protein